MPKEMPVPMLLHDSSEDERLRRRVPKTYTDPRARIYSYMLTQFVQEVFACGTRKQLDELTRRLWKRFDNGLNDVELVELRERIGERREMVDRGIGSAMSHGELAPDWVLTLDRQYHSAENLRRAQTPAALKRLGDGIAAAFASTPAARARNAEGLAALRKVYRERRAKLDRGDR